MRDPGGRQNSELDLVLIAAIESDNEAEVEALLERGVDVAKRQSSTGKSAIQLAEGKNTIIKLLQTALNRKLIESYTNEDYSITLNYLALGAEVNYRDENGATILHHAAYHSRIELLAALLEAGADINGLDNNGNSPFMYACASGNIENAKELWQLARIG